MRNALMTLVVASIGLAVNLAIAQTPRVPNPPRGKAQEQERQRDRDNQEEDKKPDASDNPSERDKQEEQKRNDRIEDARRDVDEARDRVRSAERRADRARDDREQAIRDRERYGQELTRANEDEGELTRALASAETDARAAKEAYDTAKQAADAKEQRVKEVKQSIAQIERDVSEAKKQAEADFLATEASSKRLAAIETASTELETNRQRVVEALAKTPVYQSLKRAADAAEAAVKAARDATPPNQAVLTRASNEWIDTKSKLQTAERDACERDAGYVEAAAKLQTARSAHETALEAFRASVDREPRVASQVARRSAIETEHADAQRDFAAATTSLQAATNDARARVGRYDEVRTRLANARAARDRLAAQMVAADNAIKSAELSIADADQDIARARRQLDEAQRRLSQAQR